MEIEIELTEPQSTIALTKARFKVVVAGRRFGKSYLAYAEMFKRAISREATEKGGFNIWYVANTSDNARKIMWEKFIMDEKYIPKSYIKKSNQQRMVCTFKNGSTISVFSGQEPDSLRGSSIDFLVMDECAFVKESAWTTIYPALTDKYCRGEALLISSPDGYNWFQKIYADHLDKSDPDNADWACLVYHLPKTEGLDSSWSGYVESSSSITPPFSRKIVM